MKKNKSKNRDSLEKYYNSSPDLTDFAVASAMDCTGFIPSDSGGPGALEAYLLMRDYRAKLENDYPANNKE